MKTTVRDQSSRQSGFSLIEIMVGMVIGMLGIIVMMQVFAVSEERKRTTNAGSDAQGNAALALDGMRREISRAGYGFANTRLLNCSLELPSGGGATVPLAPVIINPAVITGQDANTDTLLVAYGSSDDQPEGYSVAYQAGATYTLDGTSVLLRVGPPADRVIAAPAACAATSLRLGAVQTVNIPNITLSTSEPGTALYNLGAAPRFLAYAVRNGNLTVCDFMIADCGNNAAANWPAVANNVVSLRAQYGRDDLGAMTGIVDTYDQTTPTTNCGWARTSAVRLALVARSAQFEKENVTLPAAAPQWLGNATAVIDVSKNPDGSAMTNPDGSANPDLWKQYRYRVFETLVPLRNVAWMGVPQGC